MVGGDQVHEGHGELLPLIFSVGYKVMNRPQIDGYVLCGVLGQVE